MKFYKPKKIKEFSGRVEVVVTALDQSGMRMSARDGIDRKSIRLEETTPDETFQIILKTLEKECK